ncbi:division plane positioning ATPase MipZ [Curvivirga sp.]|uniref:division plane positioning ATPase MipZ n=1 Tax=Curvivirga sp. TaxID=2856848 RepID=UPI003B5C4168
MSDMAQTDATSEEDKALIIVVGNEKGGSGKSTTVMHLIAAMMRGGYTVAALDLDARQGTLHRYLENRKATMARKGVLLPMPEVDAILPSKNPSVEMAKAEDEAAVHAAVERLSAENDVLIIDTPGSDSFLSRAGHSYADVLITPLNDSFVDLDVLAHVDPETLQISELSQYAQMVFEQKMERAKRTGSNKTFKWVVLRNRLGQLDSRNQKAMDKAITGLAKRVGFDLVPGFSERVIFRELFLEGLTLLDLRGSGLQRRMSMTHIAARQEVRNMIQAIGLPVWKDDK